MKLEGKIALVTGSGRGIGKTVALKLAENGADIVVNDVNLESAEATAREIKALGRKAMVSNADVVNFDEVGKLFEAIRDESSRIDILVNNAGITRDALITKITEQMWDQVVAVNLKGVFNCCRHAAPMMINQGYGKIVSLSSVVGQEGNVGQVNYSATKAGVIGITKTLAKELARYKINVNAVAPGFIDTEMTKPIPEEVKQKINKKIPFGAFGLPEDVANAILFLVSDDAKYITGHVLAVNGGLYM